MALLVGFMEPLVPDDNFPHIALNIFLKTNDVQADAKLPLFITNAEPEICELLISLTVSKLPSAKLFDFLIDRFSPKKNTDEKIQIISVHSTW